jgi:hypothetical protein
VRLRIVGEEEDDAPVRLHGDDPAHHDVVHGEGPANAQPMRVRGRVKWNLIVSKSCGYCRPVSCGPMPAQWLARADVANNFTLMMVVALVALPLIFLLRRARAQPGETAILE